VIESTWQEYNGGSLEGKNWLRLRLNMTGLDMTRLSRLNSGNSQVYSIWPPSWSSGSAPG